MVMKTWADEGLLSRQIADSLLGGRISHRK